MKELHKLPIDIEDLILAMDDTARESNEYYLNRETGEIAVISTDVAYRLESENPDEELAGLPDWQQDEVKIAKEIDSDATEGARWVEIPPSNPRDAYERMVSFAETVDDPHLIDLLDLALHGKGAFRRFRDAIARYPEEEKRWLTYRDAAQRAEAIEWLETLNLVPEDA